MRYGSEEYTKALAKLPKDVQERIMKPLPNRYTITFRWTNPDAKRLLQEWKEATCGARTRKGTPCQKHPMWRNKRCKLHGGKSTGPKTPEGKAAIAESNRRRARQRQEAEATAPPQTSDTPAVLTQEISERAPRQEKQPAPAKQ